jgi:hypothetical protein
MAAMTTNSATCGKMLQVGLVYQLRIRAIKESMPVPAKSTQLSRSQDLAGVFTFQP